MKYILFFILLIFSCAASKNFQLYTHDKKINSKKYNITGDLNNLKISLCFECWENHDNRENNSNCFFRSYESCSTIPIVYKNIPALRFYVNKILLLHDSESELIILQKEETKNLIPLETHAYRVNRELIDDKIIYVNDIKIHKLGNWIIKVYRKEMRCDDTGTNSVEIENNGKKVFFQDLNNVQIFNYKQSMYIISSTCCEGKMRIFKIQNNSI